jgi:hypothetical protein
MISYNVTHDVVNGTAAHIHTGAVGVNGPITIPLEPFGTTMTGSAAVTPAMVADLEGGLWYINVHSTVYPDGEIRGQLAPQ